MPARDALCTCGHPEAAHEHYRKGSDCGVCGADTCAAFRLDPAATPDLPDEHGSRGDDVAGTA